MNVLNYNWNNIMNFQIDVSNIESDLKPKIIVAGVGGAGNNAINNMVEMDLKGVEFWSLNTDAQVLKECKTKNRLQLGETLTRGLGAGADPSKGKKAAEESASDIETMLDGCDMLFITTGMGGGTGTGAAPVLAKIAKEKGILTVVATTTPFHFEGARRRSIAAEGIRELRQYVDAMVVIPNQNLFKISNESTTFADAFRKADDVLYSAVRSVTDLIVTPGLINLDFADIQAVMRDMGTAMMGTGEADCEENRALKAAELAISNPLLGKPIRGAKMALVHIAGGDDLTLSEVEEVVRTVEAHRVDPKAHIIFGSSFDQNLEGRIRVSVVATGLPDDDDDDLHPTHFTDQNASAIDDKKNTQVSANKPRHHNDIVDTQIQQEGKITRSSHNESMTGSQRENRAESNDLFEVPSFLRRASTSRKSI